ncbi:MAG: T9SS type A sorting domain-containing protein [Bacteroidia bacterium]|nr:T9SS type A sorting domain-containing protein [Bacteroidia bacterium]
MKTTSFIIAILLFSGSLLLAQNEKKPVTIRVKKVLHVNGVEKVLDTTFTTSDPVLMLKDLPEMNLEMVTPAEGGPTLITEDISLDKLPQVPEMEWLQTELGEEFNKMPNDPASKKIIMIETSCETNDGNSKAGPKKLTKVIIKTHKMVDPTNEELKLLGKNESSANAPLELRELSFAPNPSNGITGIDLILPKKGPTTISVYNINGELVFEEKLENFSGRYQKQLDLSHQPKGIYFLSVTQNDENITKKLILE